MFDMTLQIAPAARSAFPPEDNSNPIRPETAHSVPIDPRGVHESFSDLSVLQFSK